MNPTPTHPATDIMELERSECLQLLASNRFGRIAVNVPDWAPMIRPVNYVFDERSQSVIVRSAPGSKLHGMIRSAKAAFEIDNVDPAERTGWSVIIVGVTEEITGAAELRRLRGLDLESWAPGPKEHWMRIRAVSVSGRRITLANPPRTPSSHMVSA